MSSVVAGVWCTYSTACLILNIEPTLSSLSIDILYLVETISHPNSSTALGALHQATCHTHCSESLLYLACVCRFCDMDTIRPCSLPLSLSHWVKYTCLLYFFLWLTSPSPSLSHCYAVSLIVPSLLFYDVWFTTRSVSHLHSVSSFLSTRFRVLLTFSSPSFFTSCIISPYFCLLVSGIVASDKGEVNCE